MPEVDALVHGFAGYFHCELYEAPRDPPGPVAPSMSGIPVSKVQLSDYS